MSWAVQEGLKMIKAVKRRWSNEKKLEIGLVAALCLLLWATEMMTGWFSAHFPSWFFQTVWE